MTDLVERYLAAVQRRLPEATAKDIVAELREMLLSRIEGEGARDDDAVAAILKDFGHPVVVASRYGGHDYLIGPRYYPWFWHVQRIAVGAAVAIAFGITAIRALGSEEPMRAVMRGINGAVEAGVWAFGVVTILFVLAERFKLDLKWADKWDPKSLPREHIRQPKGLFESGITVAFDIVFLLWWAKVVMFPNAIPLRGAGSASVHFSAAWDPVYWPVLVLMGLVTLVHLGDLVHPAWSRVRSMLSLAGHAAGIGVLWVLSQGRPLVDVVPENGADQAEVAKLLYLVDQIAVTALMVTGVIWAVTIGFEVWRLARSLRPAAQVVA